LGEALNKLFLPALIGLAACARPGPAPAPLVPEAPPSSVAGRPGVQVSHADSGRADSASSRPAISSPSGTPIRATDRDTASDAAFLDTLRLMTTDSVAGYHPPVTSAAAPDPSRPETRTAPTIGPGPATSGSAATPAPEAAPTWDIDVDRYTANDRVQYYVDYFRGRARWHFETYLERLGRWESLVRARLRAAGMPQDLVYLAVIESGMNPLAVSRRRAVGLWQFMPATGRRYGLAVDAWVDERRDPWRATDAAIRMLSELNDRFGSLYLAAAAYDAGPGKIQRGLKRYDFGPTQGNDLYFALADERFLRRETRDYVPKLIAAAIIAKEPEKWGFDHIERWDPLRYDSIEVRDAVGLDVLARLADTTTDAILELNPQFVRRVTPPGRPVWVRVPLGRADSAAARVAVLPPEHRVTFLEHAVARGETLGQIAVRYNVTVDLILSANLGVKPRSLRPGQVLVIPTSGIAPSRWSSASRTSRHPARQTLRRTPPVLLSTVARRGRKPASPAKPPAATMTATTTTTRRTVHIVRSGESPYTIARSFGVPLDALLKQNGLTKRSLVKPGQAIRIPS
jgi:membrane-bound lytic murein transglycosylase D